jgi:hypothetical protein
VIRSSLPRDASGRVYRADAGASDTVGDVLEPCNGAQLGRGFLLAWNPQNSGLYRFHTSGSTVRTSLALSSPGVCPFFAHVNQFGDDAAQACSVAEPGERTTSVTAHIYGGNDVFIWIGSADLAAGPLWLNIDPL